MRRGSKFSLSVHRELRDWVRLKKLISTQATLPDESLEIIEFYRYDPRGWVILQVLSTAQVVGIIVIPLAGYMLLRKKPPAVMATRS